MKKKSMRTFFLSLVMVLVGTPFVFAQTCPKPVGLQLVGATQTTATLGWQLSDPDAGSPTTYLITLLQGETVIHENIAISDPNGTRSYQMTGLTADTEYRVTLQSDCTDGEKGKSDVSDAFVFKTLSAPVGITYTNDFESKDAPLTNWIMDNSGSTSKTSTRTYYGNAQEGQSVYMYATSTDQAFIVSPQFTHAANDMEVSFWYYCNANTRFSAGVMSDPYDPATYQPILDDSVAQRNTWVYVRFNTKKSAFVDAGKSIAIMLPSGQSVSMYIDDFEVKAKPACSRPERLAVGQIDSTAVTLTWVDYENSGSYELSINDGDPQAITASPYRLPGLDKDTEYTVKVRNKCSAVDSEWSLPVTFSTLCGTAPTVAFEQNFDAETTLLPDCWFQQKTRGNGTWTISTNEAKSGSRSLMFSRQGSDESRTLLIMQPFVVPEGKSYDLSFQMYRQWEGSYESNYMREEGEGVRVWASNAPSITDPTAVELGMIHNHLFFSPVLEPVNGFYYYDFNITRSGTVYIIIEGVQLGGCNTYLDDFKVYESPKCRMVSDIKPVKSTTSTIDFVWQKHPASTATQYLVDVTTEPAPLTPATMPATVTGEAYTITGLAPGTKYTVTAKVATSCGGDNGNSVFTEKTFTYTTACNPVTVFPIKEGFEGGDVPPICWSQKQSVVGEGFDTDYGDNAWIISDPEASWRDNVFAGKYAAKMQLGKSGAQTNLIMPLADFGSETVDYILRFQLLQYEYVSNNPTLEVWLNSTPDTVGGTKLMSMMLEDETIDNWDNFEWRKQEVVFKAQGEKYIIFNGISAGSASQSIFIDDVNLFPKPDCDFLPIDNFVIDSVSTDAVRIENTDPMVTDWSVAYGAVGFNPNAEGATVKRASGSKVLVEGLAPDTEYEFYVVLHCEGGTKTGAWSESSKTFKTHCLPTAVTADAPFADSFEDLTYGQRLAGCYVVETIGGRSGDGVIIDTDCGQPDGDQCLYFNINEDPSTNVVFRSFELKTGVNYALSFSVMNYYGYTDHSLVMCVGTEAKLDKATKFYTTTIMSEEVWEEHTGYFTVPADGVYFVGYGFEYDYDSPFYIDAVSLEETACIPPLNIKLSALSDVAATMTFESDADSWEVKVASGEIDPEIGVGDVYAGKLDKKQLVLDPLLPNTEYFYTFRSVCDGVPSDWSALASFRTLCTAPAANWTESFDDPEGTVLNCWEFMSAGSGWSTWYGVDDAQSQSGFSFVLREAIAISPEFDIESLGNYELTGWALSYDEYGYGSQVTVSIGVLNDPEDIEATFIPLGNINLSEINTWYNFSIPFKDILDPEFTDSYGNPFDKAKSFVINVETDELIYFDDLQLIPLSSCPRAKETEITGIGGYSVSAGWERGDAETQWQLVVKQGDEVIADTVVKATDPGVDQSEGYYTATVDGIEPLTEYQLYIRTICAPGDTGALAYIAKFTSDCGLYSLPYDATFDNGDLTCWERGVQVPDAGANLWNIDGGALKCYESDGATMSTSFYSPFVRVVKDERVLLSLDLNYITADSVGICLLENDGQIVQRFDKKIAVIKQPGAAHLAYDITNLIPGDYNAIRIAFVVYMNGKAATVTVDNVSIERIEPCVRPVGVDFTEILASQATVVVNDSVPAHTAWQYVVVPMGADIDGVQAKPVTEKEFTVTGLTGETRYDLYIRTDCGATQSSWRGPITFMTECAPKTLPYFDSFEGMSSFDGTCYEVLQNMDGNGDPSVGFYTWSASDGDYCVQIECSKDEKTADGEDLFAMVVLPAFDEPLNNVSVSFDYLYESYNEFTPLYLGVLADINNPKSFQMIDAFGNEEGGYVSDRNWVYDVKVDLSELPAEYIGGRLAFKVQGGDGYGYDEVKVDDIQIFPLDYCYPVEKLTIDSFADNAVKFSWSIENEDIKKFEYLVTSADGSQELTAVVDTNVVKLTNLTFGTDYTIKVRSVCSETNTADWVETSFRTLSTMPEFDYITGFESDDDNNLWVLANGEATNRFIIGSDATGVAAGSQALYISDNGTANNYNTGKPTVVYAYRSIHFTPGQYLVSYKWKSMGDYQNDYARVFFAPVYLPIEGGVVDNRIGKPNWKPELNDLTGVVYPLDGNKPLRRQLTWQTRYEEITIESDTMLNLVVAWSQNGSGGTQPPLAVDDVVIEKVKCQKVENLRITALTDEGVTASFRNLNENDEVIFAISTSDEVKDEDIIDTVGGTSVSYDRLKPATEYNLFVRAKCDEVRNSAWQSVPFTTLPEAAAVPYNTNFDDDDDNSRWTYAKTIRDVNYFTIGEAVHSGDADLKSLYVTNDGSAFDYDGTKVSLAYACRVIDMPQGLYSFSYDWMCEGQTNVINGTTYFRDYARIFLAPEDVVVTPGVDIIGNLGNNGCISLDNNAHMTGQKEWTRFDDQIVVKQAGRYKLVVAWINDNYNKTSPVAIDSIEVKKLPCAPIVDFELVDAGTDTATVTFYNINQSPVSYVLGTSADRNAATEASGTTANDTVCLGNLRSDKEYFLFVKADCSETEESEWTMFRFYTECTPTVINEELSFITGFEDQAGRADLDNCWTDYNYGKERNSFKVNTTSTDYNRTPRTGKLNIYFNKGWGGSSGTGVVTREYSLEKGNFYEFSIWAINSSDYYTKVEFVEQRADDMVAFASTENIHTASYSNFTGYFQAPADSVYNLGMRATSNNDYVSFDDFSVRLVEYGTPKRFNVKDITKTSASFSWIGNADGYRFRLMFRDQVVVDSVLKGHSIDVDNLTGATNYTASVVAFRADQDTTAPATLSFFTDCDVYALPYEQNFNTAYGSEIPACWDAVTGTAIGDMRYNWATATEGSNVIARISTSGAYGTAALRSPEFSLEDEGMALSFRYINKSVVDLKVAVSTDAGKTFADTIATLTPANWTAKAIELDAKYVGKKIMVAFIVKSKAVGNGEFIAIDDFRIACYGGEKPLADVHCSGFDYLRNGFVVLKEELQPGTNTISKLFTYDITDNTATACDTLKILTLTVNPTKETHLYETICEGQTSTTAPFVGDDAKSEAGDWVKTYTSSLKCDSNVILHLTVLPKMHYISASICEGDVYEFGDLKCDTAGTYVVYGKNHLQCDSNVTLRLEVVPTHYRQTMYVCEGSRYEWVEADMVLDETKEYTYKFETAGRCDSIVTIDFHVLPTRVTVRKNVCAGAEVIFGEGSDAETITIPGTYEKTFKNSLGCDSIVTLILNYNDPIVAEYDDYTCQDYEYNNYGFNIPVITKDTVLLKTIKNDAGCDSTTKVNVDFIATIYTDSIAEIDEGGKFEFCGQTYTTAGTYTCEGRSTVTSCDSIVRLTLKVNPGVGVDNVFAQPIVIAPNPISLGETTYVEHEWTADEQHGLKVEVLNSLGQTIASYTPASYPIEVKGIEVSGVYYIRVTSGTGKVYVGKLIVR